MTSVSIVVPVLDDATLIEPALRRLRRDFPRCQLVVVDGGSTDGTAERAEPLATVVRSERGRARQMNAGAQQCTGDVLWFVHVDTAVDRAALGQIQTCMGDTRVVGGGLRLRFDRRSAGLDLLARSSNLRARRWHQIFGDQAMFVRRSLFDTIGGFPELPIMEDWEMSRRLHRCGRLVQVAATSTASARRFVEHGTTRMFIFMQYLKLLYVAGVDPEHIRRRYAAGPHRRHRHGALSRRHREGLTASDQ